MADILLTQDPTKTGVVKLNGPTLTAAGDLPLTALSVTGAVNGQAVVLTAGDWAPGNVASSDTASNLGAGGQVFKSKVAADFQFRSLVAGTNISIATNANDLTINNTASSGAFTASFISANQVITSAGALTLAHGLGGIPTLMMLYLVNTAAELGYSIGDRAPSHCNAVDAVDSYGAAVIPDATNLVIRYGSNANVFRVLNKTTGTSTTITAASWQCVFQAWR